jgi:hypothetical protein
VQVSGFCKLDDSETRVLCAAVDAENPHGGQCIASGWEKTLGFWLGTLGSRL